MARRSAFHSPSPLAHHGSLDLRGTAGPFSFLNPTRAHFAHNSPGPSSSSSSSSSSSARPAKSGNANGSTTLADGSAPADVSGPPTSEKNTKAPQGMSFRWRSRDNRKGRHTLLVDSDLPTVTPTTSHASTSSSSEPTVVAPRPTNSWRALATGLYRMLTVYPYWDVSWWVAVVFTLGSCIWVVNASFVWLPLVQPQTEFAGEIATGGGWSAFAGATVFEVGSVLLMLEAINESRSGCFGWALEKAVEGDGERGSHVHMRPEKGGCRHHHANRKNFVGKGKADAEAEKESGKGSKDRAAGGGSSASSSDEDNGAGKEAADAGQQAPQWESNSAKSWQWIPTWHDLRTHYLFELGFLACSFQMFGATVFWISGFTAIPEIYDMLPTQASINFGYWIPQIVGGSGFITSGVLFMLETQRKWYVPAFGSLGWHIGLWNLIGGFGFTLCGALGPAYGNTGAQFEASLATFWGSWAFLIGSLVQWYESLDKYPVEKMDGKELGGHDGGS